MKETQDCTQNGWGFFNHICIYIGATYWIFFAGYQCKWVHLFWQSITEHYPPPEVYIEGLGHIRRNRLVELTTEELFNDVCPVVLPPRPALSLLSYPSSRLSRILVNVVMSLTLRVELESAFDLNGKETLTMDTGKEQ